MSLKHAILGFLSFQSLSGYDLKKAFDRSVQHFWPANQSQIYRTLAKLNEDGLVEQEVVEREERLDLKLYHITPAGQDELHRWLSTPLPAADYREPFLIQLYFGSKLVDDELLAVLQHEIQGMQAKLAEFKQVYRLYQDQLATHPHPRAFFLSVLTLEYGLLNTQASLDWLKRVAERVAAKDYTFMDL